MTNTTQTYWEVDGESLQTFAYNIETLGGDREAPPSSRGSDTLVPYMPGTKFNEREVDARTITLGMWVVGANPDGTIPQNENLRRTYDRNWRHLRRLLWRPRKQFTITKRFWVETADLVAAGVSTAALPKDGLWSLYTAVARGSFAGGLNPQMTGPARANFTVDIRLSDPYFYGPEISRSLSMASPLAAVSILGDDRTHKIFVDFQGPLTAPQINNLSEDNPLWFKYGTAVSDGNSATISVKDFAATHFGTNTYKSSGFVSHDGSRFWLYLEPGACSLSLSAQDGTGTALIRYQPAWL